MLRLLGCNQWYKLNSGCRFIIKPNRCIRVYFSNAKRTALQLANSMDYAVLLTLHPKLLLALLARVINLTTLHRNHACKSYQSVLMENVIRNSNVAIPGEEIAFLLIITSHQCLADLSIHSVVKNKGTHVELSLSIMPHQRSSTFVNIRQLHLKR